MTLDLTEYKEDCKMKNLPVRNCSIECIDHPEWGTWGVYEDCGDWYIIHGHAGTRVLSKNEAERFWRRIS